MAAKRAHVSAVLTVTGASAVFTQDIVEDMTGNIIDADYEDLPPESFPEDEPEPEPDQEALFNELAAKAGLTTKKEKTALSSFVDITAQAQSKAPVVIIQSALGKHFDSFAAAFSKWQQAKESKPKPEASDQKTAPESAAKETPSPDNHQEEDASITPATLQSIEKVLTGLGAPGKLPPDLVDRYDTGDPSELSELQGKDALEFLKSFKG